MGWQENGVVRGWGSSLNSFISMVYEIMPMARGLRWFRHCNVDIGALFMGSTILRHFDSRTGGSRRSVSGRSPRLNLLLSYAGWQEQNWAEQLPCLLEPMGISSIRVNSGREAAQVISDQPIHIAVVDLRLPLDDLREEEEAKVGDEGGLRILQILRRLEAPPPTIVIRHPADRDHARAHQRSLNQALREGAFAVFDVPVVMEQLLQTMQRILKRHYADSWPSTN